MHFTFEYPVFSLLFLAVPCFYYCRKKSEAFLLPKLEWLPKRDRFLNIALLFRIALFALLVLAFMSPVFYGSQRSDPKKALAVVLALDTSGSMRETGFGKGGESKFELLQKIAGDFIQRRLGDNIGIVVFGTYAFSASPLSWDTRGVKSILDMLEVEMAGKNTAIADAIDQSLGTLSKSMAKTKIVVLVSDGRNNSGSITVREVVAKASKESVKIYTVALGENGVDTALLRKIAAQTKAVAFCAKDADALNEVYEEIDSLLPSAVRSRIYQDKKQLFIYPLLLVFILLFGYLYRRREVL